MNYINIYFLRREISMRTLGRFNYIYFIWEMKYNIIQFVSDINIDENFFFEIKIRINYIRFKKYLEISFVWF